MKIRKNIYLVLGILFILIDILQIYVLMTDYKDFFSPKSEGFGFVLTSQVILIPAFLFINGAYRVQKKIDRKNLQSLVNSFSESDNQQ